MISLIVAMDKNRAIGKQGKLPWRLSADMAYFKKMTSGHPVVMGRKTFESIGRALPDRANIVITRNSNLQIKGVLRTSTLNGAITLAEEAGWPEIFIIGGGEIFKEAIQLADIIYVTEVSTEVSDADTFFPVIDSGVWRETKRDSFSQDAKNQFGYNFVTYKRKVGEQNGEQE